MPDYRRDYGRSARYSLLIVAACSLALRRFVTLNVAAKRRPLQTHRGKITFVVHFCPGILFRYGVFSFVRLRAATKITREKCVPAYPMTVRHTRDMQFARCSSQTPFFSAPHDPCRRALNFTEIYPASLYTVLYRIPYECIVNLKT